MLLIDIGNSRIKAALVEAGRFVELAPVSTSPTATLDAWQAEIATNAPIRRILVSNVAGPEIASAFVRLAFEHWHVEPEFVRPRREFAGMLTRYEDPAQLGVDRWLAALAARQLSGSAVCVIDVGTALTVDVVDPEGVHHGGLIAPGLELMSESLSRGTAQLDADVISSVTAFAANTRDAISLGCRLAVAGLFAEVGRHLEILSPGGAFRWYLTGGGAYTVRSFLPEDHVYDPSLVLQGLAIVGNAQ